MRALAVLPLALLASGCADSFDRSVCQPVPPAVVDRIASQLVIDGGGSLRNAFAVPAAVANWHFVSADLEGPGLEGPGHVATWAVSGLESGAGLTYAVPEQATGFSRWPDVSKTRLGANSSTPEVHTSQRCVQTAP